MADDEPTRAGPNGDGTDRADPEGRPHADADAGEAPDDDFLARACADVRRALEEGYYGARPVDPVPSTPSLADAVSKGRAVVAEIKRTAPSWSTTYKERDVATVARAYRAGGAAGISVLTEPRHFQGSLDDLATVARVGLPTLMKDFVMHPDQLDAAADHGAAAVLLIQAVFDRGLAPVGRDALIGEARDRGLDVLLEASTADGFARALDSEASIVAVNARRLDTLDLSLDRALRILAKQGPEDPRSRRPHMLLSAVSGRADLERAFEAGADAVLVGTALMEAADPVGTLKSWLDG